VVRVTDLYGRNLGFLDRSRYFSIKYLLSCTHEAEWTPFQTRYFSENVVAPGIELGSLDLQRRTLTTRPQRRSPYEAIKGNKDLPQGYLHYVYCT
jgi:hypothetical protein